MKRAPDRDRVFPKWIPWAIVLLMLAALVVGYFVTTGATTAQDDKSTAQQQRDATADQAIKASLPVVALCREPGPVGDALRAAPDDPCAQARQVVSDPVPVPGPEGKQGPGPTDEQIDAAVARWLIAHPIPPGRGPSVAEITAALAAYLTDNPPQPGRPPSAAEIALEVARWFADHPVRDGEKGEPGQPGRPPTAEEIQAAVAAELAANPPPAGPEGPAGPTCPAGTTLQQVTYADQQVGQGCVFDVQPVDPLLPPMG